MFQYEVFGGVLRSVVEFPELPAADEREPHWTLLVADEPAPAVLEPLGRDVVDKDVTLELVRTEVGLALIYSDSGRFDTSADGRTITWRPASNARIDDVRLDVLGRVFAAALHQSGFLCLHASAVVLGHGAIALLAPKFRGKSTLALALTSAGAKLLTDDTLPVEFGTPPLAWPGVHQIRLWNDSAARLAERDRELPAGAKHHVAPEGARCSTTPAPLAAIYLMSAAAAGTEPPVVREQLSPVQAAVALVGHEKGGAVMRGSMSQSVLDRCAVLASRVPVYALGVVRDYQQLPIVVDQLFEWHGANVMTGAGAR